MAKSKKNKIKKKPSAAALRKAKEFRKRSKAAKAAWVTIRAKQNKVKITIAVDEQSAIPQPVVLAPFSQVAEPAPAPSIYYPVVPTQTTAAPSPTFTGAFTAIAQPVPALKPKLVKGLVLDRPANWNEQQGLFGVGSINARGLTKEDILVNPVPGAGTAINSPTTGGGYIQTPVTPYTPPTDWDNEEVEEDEEDYREPYRFQAGSLVELFEDEGHWSGGDEALDENGDIENPRSEYAVSWNLTGGIKKVYSDAAKQAEVTQKLERIISLYTFGECTSVVQFEEDYNTEDTDIQRVIALAQV